MKNKYFFIVVAVFAMLQIQAQSVFKGKVVDADNIPILGATILSLENTKRGTTSDFDGNFSIKLKNSQVKISSVGYKTQIVILSSNFNTISLKENAENLEEVIVSANRVAQKRLEVPAAVGVLSTKQLKETKATQIDQLLNQMTGVFMSNLGNESHTMSIRSPLSYRSLFLFTQDGIPIRPTGNFSHAALKDMDQASFKRIEVVRGSNSAVYGSEAIGGVINAITMSPTEDISGKISFQGNDIGYRRTEFNIANTVGKTGFFVGGHYALLRDGWRDHSDMDKIGTTFKVTHKASDKLDFNLTYTYTFIDSERTGNLNKKQFDSFDLTSLQTFTYSKSTASRANLFTNYKWNDKNLTRMVLFFRDYQGEGIPHFRIKRDRKVKGRINGEISKGGFQSYGAMLEHTLKSDFWDSRFSFGGSLDYSPSNSNKRRIHVTKDPQGRYISYKDINKVFEDYTIDYYNYAGFAQFDVSPIENLKISGALRFDYFKYDYTSTKELTLLAGVTGDNISFKNVTPKIGVTYDLKNNKGIYANYSLGFVPPQTRQVYGADLINRAIEPQRFNNYEIGTWLGFNQNKGYLDLALYDLRGQNELVTVILEDGSQENKNAGKTSHRGIELGLKYKLLDDLKFRFNGTYAHHKYEEFVNKKKVYTNNFMERAPKWIWNTGVTYSPNYFKGFRIGFEYQHLGEYYQSPINDETKKYPGFDLFHIRAGYKFLNNLKGLELWLNVINVTDKKYAENSDVSSYSGKQRYRPGNPRNFNIGIQYNFGR